MGVEDVDMVVVVVVEYWFEGALSRYDTDGSGLIILVLVEVVVGAGDTLTC